MKNLRIVVLCHRVLRRRAGSAPVYRVTVPASRGHFAACRSGDDHRVPLRQPA